MSIETIEIIRCDCCGRRNTEEDYKMCGNETNYKYTCSVDRKLYSNGEMFIEVEPPPGYHICIHCMISILGEMREDLIIKKEQYLINKKEQGGK